MSNPSIPPKTASPSTNESHPAMPLAFDLLFLEDTEPFSVSSVVPYAVPFFIKLLTVPLISKKANWKGQERIKGIKRFSPDGK